MYFLLEDVVYSITMVFTFQCLHLSGLRVLFIVAWRAHPLQFLKDEKNLTLT